MEKRPFSELGLNPELLRAVDKLGFEEASPIQTAVIPVALTGRDLVGQSATGSGKTAAFGLPAISCVDVQRKEVQVLVLCPTRELAVQVAEEIGRLAAFSRGLHAVPIYGGQSYERQFRALAAGVQIVIGTPGRILDHMERGTLHLDKVRMVVLDEADRMLDMGFRDDIEMILSRVPTGRQRLFFSATMPPAIRGLITRFAADPAWIKIEAHARNAPAVDQVYFEVDRRSKIDVLTRVIDLYDFRYGIIFCSTKVMVDELDEHLHARGYASDRLHGDLSQAQRDRVMDKFRRRAFEFLVATDVAARGLDVDELEVVFNFDLPNDAEDYTHRIGRTGRAGHAGKAFTFVSGRELWKLQGMMRFAGLKIRRAPIPSLDQVEEARASLLFEKVRGLLSQGTFRRNDALVERWMEEGFTSTDICSALIALLQGGEAAPAGDSADKAPRPASAPERAPVAKKTSAAPAAESMAAESRPVRTAPPERMEDAERPERADWDRPAAPPRGRTGREEGFTTLFLNVGRKNLIQPGDVVGKIAGVSRLPARVVGSIDIRQRHTLVDVATEHADFIMDKLRGVRVKGQALHPALATAAHQAADSD
jgi:ATP-dependent RNA helicase DeaD